MSPLVTRLRVGLRRLWFRCRAGRSGVYPAPVDRHPPSLTPTAHSLPREVGFRVTQDVGQDEPGPVSPLGSH
jgi:hypothetical protein